MIGLVLLVYGTQLCWAVRGNTVPSLGVSRAVAYVPLPVSGLLMVMFALPQIITGRPSAEDAAGEGRLMELLVLFGVLFALLVIGVPVAFSLLAAALACFLAMDIPPIVAVQRVAAGISVFTLMAIPFFIFAGDLMYRAGIAERLVRVADAAIGRVRGGLGIVDVGASMMFGAVSGSAIASASAIGSTMVPLMKDKGYPGDYAGQCHRDRGDRRPADPALAQHDHLFRSVRDRGLDRRPVPRRRAARHPDRRHADAGCMARRKARGFADRPIPRLARIRARRRLCHSRTR